MNIVLISLEKFSSSRGSLEQRISGIVEDEMILGDVYYVCCFNCR